MLLDLVSERVTDDDCTSAVWSRLKSMQETCSRTGGLVVVAVRDFLHTEYCLRLMRPKQRLASHVAREYAREVMRMKCARKAVQHTANEGTCIHTETLSVCQDVLHNMYCSCTTNTLPVMPPTLETRSTHRVPRDTSVSRLSSSVPPSAFVLAGSPSYISLSWRSKNRVGSRTYSRMSLGFSIRLTAANLRVFFALT